MTVAARVFQFFIPRIGALQRVAILAAAREFRTFSCIASLSGMG
jgi:hypothetical protein